VAISFVGGGNRRTRRKSPTWRKSMTNFITQCCIEYILPRAGLKLTTLVVIDMDCTGSCNSNYHTITTALTELQTLYKTFFFCNCFCSVDKNKWISVWIHEHLLFVLKPRKLISTNLNEFTVIKSSIFVGFFYSRKLFYNWFKYTRKQIWWKQWRSSTF
jgi:hypothetical protein